MQGLGFLPGASVSDAHGVSRDGSVIVGVSGAGFSPTSPREAFRWENGMMTGLGFLPGDTGSAASGVSADGSTIIGGSFVVGGIGSNNFRWTQAIGMEYLGPGPGGSNCDAIGVSGDGSVIVGTCYAATRGYASIWTEATGVRALEEVLVNDYGLDLTGWMLIVAFSVSPSGDAITGWGINPAGEQEAFLAVLSCTADCDRSSGSGVLDVFDFLCFQDLFVSGDPYACDCDTTTGARTCDVFDFLCFQDAFVAGCP
jgi:probable HAF family extracellular repeat protein